MFIDDIQNLSPDILTCDGLFEELFDVTDDIERTHLIFAIQDKAKDLGMLKRFNMMLKQYERLLKRGGLDAAPHYEMQFKGLDQRGLIPMDTGCWIANDNEIYSLTPFGKRVACTHAILPEQILTNAETGLCKIRLAYKKGGRWKDVCVDKEIIASSSKIVELAKYGIRVTTETSKALVQYLADVEANNEDLIPEQMSTSRLGWINGEFMPYGKNVIFDNEQNLKGLFDSIQSVGSRDKWYQLAKEQRKRMKIEINLYLVAALASTLVEIVNGLPFVVSLWGETGKGKTVALMLATSIWADPAEGQYMSDAKATSTALELRLNFLNSLPMLLDDMAQVKNQYEGNFSELIYRWCAGKGKERATRDLGLKQSTTWHNCIITNAEHSLITSTMQGGAVNRIIDIEMAEGEMFENGNAVVEIVKNNYGWCGREFIDVVRDLGPEKIKEIQKKYYSKIMDCTKGTENAKEEKQILPMSILMAADEISEEYLFKDGVRLNFDQCVALLKNKNEVSENERTYQYLVDEIIRNDSKFVHEKGNDRDRDVVISEQWGIIDEDKRQAIIVRTVFNDILKRGGFSDRTFLSWASRRGLIELDNDGIHKDKKKRIRGTITRCVYLNLEADGFEDASDDIPF